jgi:hypothetical protein
VPRSAGPRESWLQQPLEIYRSASGSARIRKCSLSSPPLPQDRLNLAVIVAQPHLLRLLEVQRLICVAGLDLPLQDLEDHLGYTQQEIGGTLLRTGTRGPRRGVRSRPGETVAIIAIRAGPELQAILLDKEHRAELGRERLCLLAVFAPACVSGSTGVCVPGQADQHERLEIVRLVDVKLHSDAVRLVTDQTVDLCVRSELIPVGCELFLSAGLGESG